MNKAFVKEPESGADRCPHCGSIGRPVPRVILERYVAPSDLAHLAEPAAFCLSDTCPVAYFDAFDRVALAERLLSPVYPKDPTAPICACFGATCEVIDLDLDEGSVTRTRALVERAKSDAARCAAFSPTGQSCIADVQRYYMKHRNG